MRPEPILGFLLRAKEQWEKSINPKYYRSQSKADVLLPIYGQYIQQVQNQWVRFGPCNDIYIIYDVI